MNVIPLKISSKLEANSPVKQTNLLGRLGDLTVRLAETQAELKEAQHIRYRVFYEEMSAKPSEVQRTTRRDDDGHDDGYDHLIILDNLTVDQAIVGTQRVQIVPAGNTENAVYSQKEFDIAGLVSRKTDHTFMELGRSCIIPSYRNKRTMELLWQGTWAYAVERRVDVMVGCASISVEDVNTIAPALGFISRNAQVAPEWDVPATMDECILLSDYLNHSADLKTAMRLMPPLLKGYMRLGAKFASQAVIDHQFGTVDLFVVLRVCDISERYLKFYGSDASRHRA